MSNRGKYPKSQEHRQKISETLKRLGIRPKTLGLPISDETKRRMSLASMGRKRKPFSAETRRRMSEARLGKPVSLETREKLRQHNLGKKQSEESRKKRRGDTQAANEGIS